MNLEIESEAYKLKKWRESAKENTIIGDSE